MIIRNIYLLLALLILGMCQVTYAQETKNEAKVSPKIELPDGPSGQEMVIGFAPEIFSFKSKISGDTYSLDFPCTPEYQQQTKPTVVGDIQLEMHLCSEGEEVEEGSIPQIKIASITHFPKELLVEGQEKVFFDSYVSGIARGMNGEEISREEIEFKDYVTIDSSVKSNLEGTDTYIHGRYMLINGAVYGIQVFDNQGEITDEIKQFFDSFEHKM